MANASTREAWLEAAARELGRSVFPADVWQGMPPYKLSVGWPKGARGKGHAIGQCWSGKSAADGATHHIYIAPNQTDPVDVLAVLAHELVHAAVGCEAKHGREFSQLAAKLGLVKPWTATTPSDGLREVLTNVARVLGEYPHVGLHAPLKKQSTRMRLWECPCGVKVRRAGELNAECKDCGGMFERK